MFLMLILDLPHLVRKEVRIGPTGARIKEKYPLPLFENKIGGGGEYTTSKTRERTNLLLALSVKPILYDGTKTISSSFFVNDSLL